MKVAEKKILVLGGTGLFGEHVVQKLLRNEKKVKTLSRNKKSAEKS